jgi:hypothetical protein
MPRMSHTPTHKGRQNTRRNILHKMWSSPTRSTSPWNNIPFNRKKKNINRHTTPPPHMHTHSLIISEKKKREEEE